MDLEPRAGLQAHQGQGGHHRRPEEVRQECGDGLLYDPDREGEAISWHLKQLLNLPDEKTRRVTFNEITKNVVQESIREPRDIDQKLVDAQQALSLDRIVGYELSPLLWKKIAGASPPGGSSPWPPAWWTTGTGRSRSSNLRSTDSWMPTCSATTRLSTGRTARRREPKSAEDVDAVVHETKHAPFTVKTVKRTAAQPLSALHHLHHAAGGVPQALHDAPADHGHRPAAVRGRGYRGRGHRGPHHLYAYRSVRRPWPPPRPSITGRYGEHYAQAPTATRPRPAPRPPTRPIRPSKVNWTPEQLKKDLTGEQYRLYRVEPLSGQPDGQRRVTAVEVEAAGHSFRASSSSLKFSGYTAVYEEGKDEEKKNLPCGRANL